MSTLDPKSFGEAIGVLENTAYIKGTSGSTTSPEGLFTKATVGTTATLYPGAAESLERLAAAGLPLGVVTNKARAFSVRLLERLAVAPRFAAVVCGDDGWPKKPAADMMRAACAQLGHRPAETLLLGDSANDAFEELDDAGFAVSVATSSVSNGRDGDVVSQNPAGGRAPEGSTVTITVGVRNGR